MQQTVDAFAANASTDAAADWKVQQPLRLAGLVALGIRWCGAHGLTGLLVNRIITG